MRQKQGSDKDKQMDSEEEDIIEKDPPHNEQSYNFKDQKLSKNMYTGNLDKT